MQDKSPLTVRAARAVYDNPWIGVVEHDVMRPDGSDGLYGVVNFKSRAIAILPLAENGDTWLVGQHRFPLNRYSWEIPEGGGALDRPPLEAAQRELAEETGLRARQWREILQMDLSNSVTDEAAHGFVAWDLAQGAPDPDPTEVLETRRLPFAEVFEMALSGEIRDALSLAMIFKARLLALSNDAPEDLRARLLPR